MATVVASRGRGAVSDGIDESGRALREFEIAGMKARVMALNLEGTLWRIEVGGGEDGRRECRGTLDDATWLAVSAAREISERGAEMPNAAPIATNQANLEGA
jgi:hypothetical protein